MKTQGFTLIELLAVIVILAIIALIATPIVLGIIDDTKESAQIRSAEMYLSGVENAVMRENMNSGGNFRPSQCTITSEGNLDCEGKDGIIEVEVNGENPKNGSIVFENGKIKEVTLTYESGTIVKDSSGKLVYSEESSLTYTSLGNYQHQASNGTIEDHDTESGTCSKCGETVLAPGLYDDEGNMTMSWEDLTAKDKELTTECGCASYDSILSINDGVLTSSYCGMDMCTAASEYLIGKLVLDNSIIGIDIYTFANCKSLTSIVIPDSVTEINYNTFYGCENLASITIPNSVTSIEEYAFMYCTSLKSVTISNSITNIEYAAFWGCENLTSVTFKGTKDEWNSISKVINWHGDCPEITVHCLDGDIII